MPYLANLNTWTINEAIEKAIADTVERAKDIWGLDYADDSRGLYPAGNVIGRTQYRFDHSRGLATSNWTAPNTYGGEWRTNHVANNGAGVGAALTFAGATGWATTNWLDFILSNDYFIIHEGMFSRAQTPSITEMKMVLSGVELPVMALEEIYVNGEDMVKGFMEVPNVVSPNSQCVYQLRSGIVANGNINVDRDEPFGMLGECISKRSWLIRLNY